MVARFATGSSLTTALNYNEKKVQKGVAELLTAVNYPLDATQLSFSQKLFRLENQAALNRNVTANSVHISLNFDPSEKPDNDTLAAIADAYMDKIGFGEQPYLVYRHMDAGHPHIHIVSVKVRADGSRIETQNIGRNQSQKAREEIEKEFGLVQATDKKQQHDYRPEPIGAQQVKYGKTETKRAISGVLRSVLDTYKYCSLHELNAVLKLYNVTAIRGAEDSSMRKNNGLMYQVLDDKGKPTGVPIKASRFYMQPTLKNLEGRFARIAGLKEPFKGRVKTTIDMAFRSKPRISLPQLIKMLEKEGISTVLRENESGRIYGITYIDHKSKVVFNGSDLGRQYSANAIQERCGAASQQAIKPQPEKQAHDHIHVTAGSAFAVPAATNTESVADALMKEEYTGENMPFQLRKKKKKKSKGISDH